MEGGERERMLKFMIGRKRIYRWNVFVCLVFAREAEDKFSRKDGGSR